MRSLMILRCHVFVEHSLLSTFPQIQRWNKFAYCVGFSSGQVVSGYSEELRVLFSMIRIVMCYRKPCLE